MKTVSITSILLFLMVTLVAVFLGGREINKAIKDTIDNNVNTELQTIKDKINQQSELINSIINLNNKNDNNKNDNSIENESNTDTPSVPNNDVSTNVENACEFQYIKENGGITITGYTGKQTTVKIPETIENLPVLKIGEEAFANSKIKSVTIPSSCTEIDWFAFYGCYALSSIHMSDSIKNIGYGAFDACSKSLTIHCSKNSYAEQYAKSFGISYTKS